MTDETLFLVGDLVMFTAIMGAFVFAASYAIFFSWRKTHAGKALMFFVCSLLLWATQSFAARMNPDYWGRPYSRILVYALISVTVWGLVATLWRSWGTTLMIESKSKEKGEEL